MTYRLLTSGNGQKIEQFGERVLSRPSSLCIWRSNGNPKIGAEYLPKDDWKVTDGKPPEWSMNWDGLELELRLQTNGQVGLFPEHRKAIDALLALTKAQLGDGELKVLNLFAYTGLASVLLAKAGASVTHVDLSKQVTTWARTNCEKNQVQDKVRFIVEDALLFLEREVRRGSKYHIVVADPPSFSRLSKTKTWTLDDSAVSMVRDIYALLEKSFGAVLLSSHHAIGAEAFGNLLFDCHGKALPHLEIVNLSLNEAATPRLIPAGSALVARVF